MKKVIISGFIKKKSQEFCGHLLLLTKSILTGNNFESRQIPTPLKFLDSSPVIPSC
jgi:hypothetical protein